MCLIIHRIGGSNVPNDVLDYNRKKNSDGFGLAWRENGELKTEKWAPSNYDGFRSKLKQLDKQVGLEYTAHYRMATHGPACLELSHPFTYEDETEGTVAVFHNGIIQIDTNTKTDSDTSTFVKRILANMPSGWWRNPALVYLVEEAIGYSRLLIMTATETVRLNESAWQKNGGIMYSTDPGGSHTKYKPQGQQSKWTPKGSGQYASPATKATGGLYVPGKGQPVTPMALVLAKDVKSTDSCDYGTGFIDSDDDDVQTWTDSNGHRIESLGEEPIGGRGEDIQVEAVCIECNTIGEVYVIEGTTFIDVSHDGSNRDDDDEDMDALTMASVFAN